MARPNPQSYRLAGSGFTGGGGPRCTRDSWVPVAKLLLAYMRHASEPG